MKKLIIIPFILISFLASATDYYVKNGGSDLLDGLSDGNAWETLAKINSTAFSAGDNIYLKKGSTFEGVITITESGSLASPITISSYGTGNDPVVSAFSDISGSWSDEGGNIWSKAVTSTDIKYLTIGGVNYNRGRTPNTGWYDITTGGSQTELIDNIHLTQANDYWNGAEVVVRVNEYWSNVRTITDFDAATDKLIWAVNTTYALVAGYGYYLQDAIVCLDQSGEWCFDGSKVYLYYASDPSALTIKAGIYQDAITISGSHIVIDGLDITGYYRDGIRVQTASHGNQFKNNNITYCVTAINLLNTDTYLIDSNTIEDIGNNGIYITTSDTGRILSNTIEDIGIIPGYGDIGLHAVFMHQCDSATIMYNDVDSVGYTGLFSRLSDRIHIKKNRVQNYCYLMSDGGGIYSYQNDTLHTVRGANYTGCVWKSNFVRGCSDQTAEQASSPSTDTNIGLYIDGGSSYHTLDSNLVIFNRYNIFGNSPSNCNITNNYVTKSHAYASGSNRGCEIYLVKAPSLDSAYNNNVYSNYFITNWQTEYGNATWPFSVSGDKVHDSMSQYDSNYYHKATGIEAIYATKLLVFRGSTYDISTWVAGKGGAQEKEGILVWDAGYTNTTRDQFVDYDYNFSDSPRSFDLEAGWSYFDILGNVVHSKTLQPYEGIILLRINNNDLGINLGGKQLFRNGKRLMRNNKILVH